MALIKCNNCGGIVSDRAKACPHCGAPIGVENVGNDQPAFNQQQNTEVRPSHVAAQQPAGYYEEPKRKSNVGLIVAAVLGLLALLGAGGWLWYDNHQKRVEQERQIAILAEKARQDSIAAAELREQARQDSIAEAMHQQLIDKSRQSYIDVLRGYINKYGIDEYVYWGYFLYDITQDGVPELWVKAGTCEADNMTYIYTLRDGVASKVDEIGTFHSSIHRGDKYILICMAYMGTAQWNKITYDGSKIKEKVIFEEDGVDNDTKFYTHCSEPEVTMYRFDDYSPIYGAIR